MLFQSSDPYKLPPRSLATSLTLHTLGLAILCWAALPASSLRPHKFHAVLLAPVEEIPAAHRRTLPASPPPERAAPLAPLEHARHALLLPSLAAPKPALPKLMPPELALPAPLLLPETPLALPRPEQASFTPPVKLGTFEKPTTSSALPVPEVARVQAAGFDTALEVAHAGQNTQRQRGLATGSFDTVAASQGDQRQGSVKRASGFGDAQAVEGTGGQRSAVLAANFGDAKVARPEAVVGHPGTAARAATVPAEILDKPRPTYTDEARRLNIQGEVLLEVAFDASGAVRVLSVIRGLGHGLDETAAAAARQIHFRPARRDGQPVDSIATIHIVFQLAN